MLSSPVQPIHFRGNRGIDAIDGEGDDRRAVGHGVAHGKAERLRPVDGEEQFRGIVEKLALVGVADLTQEFDAGSTQKRIDECLEVVAIDLIDLGCQVVSR